MTVSDKGREWAPALRGVGVVVGSTALHLVGGAIGLALTIPPGYSTAVFPAAGLGVACALVYGRLGILGVLVGAYLLSLAVGSGPWVALWVAVSVTAQAVAAWGGLRRVLGDRLTLDRGSHLIRLTGVVAVTATISSTLAVPVLVAAGEVSRSDALVTWLTWYVGDVFGLLVFLPLGLALLGASGTVWTVRRLRMVAPVAFAFLVFAAIFLHVRDWEAQHRLEPLVARGGVLIERVEIRSDILHGRLLDLGRSLATLGVGPASHAAAEALFEDQPVLGRLVWRSPVCEGACVDVVRPGVEPGPIPPALDRTRAAGLLVDAGRLWAAVPIGGGTLGVHLLAGQAARRIEGAGLADMSLFLPELGFGSPGDGRGPVLRKRLHLFGAHYDLELRPTLAYLKRHRAWVSWSLLAGGMLFTSMLGFLIMAFTGSTDRLEAMVGARTQALDDLARHDQLTQALNRRAIDSELETLRARGLPFAVLFVDLDRFKRINDSLGHAAGDQVLAEIAGRLRRCVRHDDHVARLGGDEFVLTLNGVRGSGAAEAAGAKIVEALRAPLHLGDRTLRISASVGVALWPQDAQDAEALLSCADRAMYAVKEAGRDDFRLFAPALGRSPLDRLELEQRLHQAVQTPEVFEPFFQPQFNLQSGQLVGAEALVRWRQGDRIINPGVFIEVAEELGLMVAIGEACTEHAFACVAAWDAQSLRLPRLAINVSAKQLAAPQMVETLMTAVERHGLAPSRVTVELTEHVALGDQTAMAARLAEIRGMGCRISLDDFGTGYATLDLLQVLPLDELKIDRRFVTDFAGNGGSITLASITLARALGLKTVAEGVEHPEQADILIRVGCDEVQGFLYGRPVPAAAFAEVLRKAQVGHDFVHGVSSDVS